VSSAVSNLDGVQHVEVRNSGEIQLTFDSSKISLEEIEKVINNLGYEIRN
jgi:copper chaperone